eukprot:TRINITY_DN21015_c0_g1_i1.p1 TRINITY_DN21015_c0_g1~~TRINITY_DN21015_c0_g1_i1.p1  ORF type:complete len:176 (+),score=3.83 TRINITY_DN21015_c0_g1_i1:60-530(+)
MCIRDSLKIKQIKSTNIYVIKNSLGKKTTIIRREIEGKIYPRPLNYSCPHPINSQPHFPISKQMTSFNSDDGRSFQQRSASIWPSLTKSDSSVLYQPESHGYPWNVMHYLIFLVFGHPYCLCYWSNFLEPKSPNCSKLAAGYFRDHLGILLDKDQP